MVQFREIEDVFLSILKEDCKRDEINGKIQNLKVYDWQKLYQIATNSGLFPIFYIKLLSLNLENIPHEFLSKFKNLYLLNLKRNILLEQELYQCNAWWTNFFINPYGLLQFCHLTKKFSVDLTKSNFRQGFYDIFPKLLNEKFRRILNQV